MRVDRIVAGRRFPLLEGTPSDLAIFLALLVLVLIAVTVHAERRVDVPVGFWEGIVTGRDPLSARPFGGRVRLQLREDHTWTLLTDEWHAAGTALVRGSQIVLQGEVIASDSPTVRLGPARWVLTLRGDETLVGSGIPQFLGEHIVTDMRLRRIRQRRAPS